MSTVVCLLLQILLCLLLITVFFTSNSLKGILGANQLNKYVLGEGIEEGLGFGKLYIKYQYHLCYGFFTSAEYRAFYLLILLDQILKVYTLSK